ncbi:hypothetical protein AB6H17_02810 [Proteus vulgaris]|uniref:hypothetical protein n=1 Tax=Proteus vulgaris TaxID=585 RepID=UPI0034DD506A
MKLFANSKIMRSIANIPKPPEIVKRVIIKSFQYLSTISFSVLALGFLFTRLITLGELEMI